MHGCKRLLLALILYSLAGCGDDEAGLASATIPPEEIGSSFDPKNAGSIEGRVTWSGDIPHVPAFQVRAYLDYLNTSRLRGEQPNPHAPIIDPESHGVNAAVVILRHVKPAPAKPWRHGPAQVEVDAERIAVVQNNKRRSIGFVSRGATIDFVCRDAGYHTLRARGAAFFALPFATHDRPTPRTFSESGLVELSEGVGIFWRRAYLFVLEHPYAALSDKHGHFVLDQVPVGTYELTAWLPNWHVERHERDPETGAVSRLVFAPPLELKQSVTVTAGSKTPANFVMSSEQFAATNAAR